MNSIVIGHEAVGKGSNTTVLGNSQTVSTYIHGETELESLKVIGQIIIQTPQGDISMGVYQ